VGFEPTFLAGERPRPRGHWDRNLNFQDGQITAKNADTNITSVRR